MKKVLPRIFAIAYNVLSAYWVWILAASVIMDWTDINLDVVPFFSETRFAPITIFMRVTVLLILALNVLLTRFAFQKNGSDKVRLICFFGLLVVPIFILMISPQYYNIAKYFTFKFAFNTPFYDWISHRSGDILLYQAVTVLNLVAVALGFKTHTEGAAVKKILQRISAIAHCLAAAFLAVVVICTGVWEGSRIGLTGVSYQITTSVVVCFVFALSIVAVSAFLTVIAFKATVPRAATIVCLAWLCLNVVAFYFIPTQSYITTLYAFTDIVTACTGGVFVLVSVANILAVALNLKKKAEEIV